MFMNVRKIYLTSSVRCLQVSCIVVPEDEQTSKAACDCAG